VFIGLLLLGVCATPAFAARQSAADAARAQHNRILAYWTPQRMAAAQPRDFVRTSNGFKPYAKPGGGGGVTGASWPNLKGKISTVEGKVFFSMDGGNWQCSGTTVADATNNNYSLVLTAGHCTYDETNGHGNLNGFATNWMFMPAWDRQPATFSTACTGSYYGCWTAAALFVDSGFANAGGFTDTATYHDWGFIKVGPGGKNNTLLESLGTFALGAGSVAKNDPEYAYGFPAAGKYHGNDLTYCTGPVVEDANNSNKTWGLACDMTGGSSGGGWLDGSNGSGDTGVLGSLNSYGYSGVKNMYGPKFNSNTTSTFSEANTRTASYVVPVTP
jgi:hypothetical protein